MPSHPTPSNQTKKSSFLKTIRNRPENRQSHETDRQPDTPDNQRRTARGQPEPPETYNHQTTHQQTATAKYFAEMLIYYLTADLFRAIIHTVERLPNTTNPHEQRKDATS